MLLTITVYHNRYVVECEGSQRLNILNYNSMVWHLKHKVGLKKAEYNAVFLELASHGKATLQLVKQAAA
jgi:hypothetical protein